MNASNDKTMNKAKTAANAITFVVLTLLALVFVNVVANRFARRADFTEYKLYSLSSTSKDVVSKLTDRMTVKAFISKDLEPREAQNAQYLRDMLEEYARASNGKFVWEAIDPTGNREAEEQAEKLKVPKRTHTGASSDKLTIAASYLGVALEYGGKVESLPAVESQEALEYQLTTLIKMLAVKKKKLVFAVSEGETALNAGPQGGHANTMSMFGRYLGEYDIDQKALTGALLGDDVDALVIAGPRQPMGERAKYVVDQFLMKGKGVAFWVDGMVVEDSGNGMPQMGASSTHVQLGRKVDHGLDDLLEHYGFKIHDDIVLDAQRNAPGPLPVRGQLALGNHPVFPIGATDPKDPITEQIQGIIFPLASSVEQVAGKQPDAKVIGLAKSSADAWRQAGLFVFDPEAPAKPTPDKGPFTFAFSSEGKLTSFFAGKDHPNEKGEKVAAPAPNTSLAPGEDRPLDASTGNPRIVVVGTSNFTANQYLQVNQMLRGMYDVDIAFGLNTIDWLVQDDSVKALRRKVISTRQLMTTGNQPLLAKYGNIIGVPLLFILFGIVRWRLRTTRRRNATL